MNAFIKGILLGLLLAWVLFCGISFVSKKNIQTPHDAGGENALNQEEALSIQGENSLLKKMLGQVESQIVILGPIGKKSDVQGKLVWDKTLQQGFFHVEGLDAVTIYQLVLITKQGVDVLAAEDAGQSPWQMQFKTPQRVLDLASVEIRGKTSQTERAVYARGLVSEN